MRRAEAIFAAILVVVILGTSFISLVAANGSGNNSYILKPEAREELIAFVNEAKDFVLAEGKDKALQAFNDPKGKFVSGELYIVAHDFNGTILAQPYKPETIGQNDLNSTDSNGVTYSRDLLEVAERGHGFAYHIRPNSVNSNTQELKLTYVLKVDDELCLASGVYLPGKAPIFSNESRKDLMAFVERARDFALNHTKEDALKAFNDKNGEFVRGNLYIYAYDFKGNTLALPFEPKMVGTNQMDAQDPNGVYLVQEFLNVAKSGIGFVYAVYQDPKENMIYRPKLCYVMKVNDEWFLGSGIY